MAVPGTLQQKILTTKDNYNIFGLTEEDVEKAGEDVISFAVEEVVENLIQVVELREKDSNWMDIPDGVHCHLVWDTTSMAPMFPPHFSKYIGVYSKISNETTLIECLADEGKDWKDRDQDEWRCEKCWKSETVIRKRNIYLFGGAAMADEGEGREDYLCHTYDPREKRVLLTCNSCQKMIETEIEEPETETEMCVECGICDLMYDDIGPLKGRFMMSGRHDLDEEGEVSFFYNGDHCPTCVKKRRESYESMLWRSGRTVSDYFGSGWILARRDEKEWKLMGPLYDDSDDDLELTSDEEDEEDEERRTYRGEYENVESEDEEQSRSALEIMDKVKDIGEILFDYQEKLKEGDYLKICDLLQGIVKDSNTL